LKRFLFFISCGRCGTTRIAEILKEKLPPDQYTVVHQMKYSRLANVIGNLMLCLGSSEKIKKLLYYKIIAAYQNNYHFISADPLTAMVIPKSLTDNPGNYIIHIQREPGAFAESMYSFSRKRLKSFIAHNFIPFWQLGILPLENIMNKNIKDKYKYTSAVKNSFFENKYGNQKNYIRIDMNNLFSERVLQTIIEKIFDEKIKILEKDLKKKSNEST